MDVAHFLKQRTSFIRQFYATAATPYADRLARIETAQEPWNFNESEESEPPFLEEWLEADESLQVLGRSCISMLAATLHAYFEYWVQAFEIPIDKDLEPLFKKSGWLKGYKAYFSRHAGIDFATGPSNLAVLEELILARNQIQHPASIIVEGSRYSESDLKKLRHPFFVDEREMSIFAETDESVRGWLALPSIRVTSSKLVAAIAEVEKLCEWIEAVDVSPSRGTDA